MTTRADVVNAARDWIGTPFRPQQSVRGHGCDCVGLIIGVARELGLVPSCFNVGPYKQRPQGYRLPSIAGTYMRRLPISERQPGDVVEIRFDTEPQHLAILSDYRGARLGVIHALTLSGKVVEHRLDSAWSGRITAVYALPGVV